MTSWEESHRWYDEIVGLEGHYYHQHVILPNVLRLLDLKATPHPALLDLGCGQGVLARAISPIIPYHGLDLSTSLIQSAKKTAAKNQYFSVADITKPYAMLKNPFTHAAALLSLQNVEDMQAVFVETSKHLSPNGILIIVLNHPCFRIPRQSHWGIDESKKLQYRRIDHYLSDLKIPIQTNPGKKERSVTTFSFHHSLSTISSFLFKAGFVITNIEEWTSDKKSTGKNGAMENRARAQFPLFLCLKAMKRP